MDSIEDWNKKSRASESAESFQEWITRNPNLDMVSGSQMAECPLKYVIHLSGHQRRLHGHHAYAEYSDHASMIGIF